MDRIYTLAILVFLVAGSLFAQDTKFEPQDEQIPGPDKAAITADQCCYRSDEVMDSAPAFKAWIEDVRHWRRERLIRMGYDGSEYERPELKWTQSSFIQPQMMIEERYFYDPVAGKYTVDRYLDDLEKRYGGIDSVLIWHVYPNIGIDNRNQHDLLHDMPGGVAGLRQMIADFHRRGVRVLFPGHALGPGHARAGMPNWEATAQSHGRDRRRRNQRRHARRRAARFPQGLRPNAAIPWCSSPKAALPTKPWHWNNMTWGYWKYHLVPMVSRYKWIEPRHMVNVCDRWNRDKTDDLQSAFFNGVGYESWENIWGIWNQITPRDAEALRRIAKIERAFASLLISPDWEPHTPTLRQGVFASKFPGAGANALDDGQPQSNTTWRAARSRSLTKSGMHVLRLLARRGVASLK